MCGKCFQFSKQKKIHEHIHTKTGLYRCLHCDRHFTLNSTMLVHAATHNTSIQCELCPKTSDKRYNSTYALALHTQRMHGPRWTSVCHINFKWKSAYTWHIKKCDTCQAAKEQERKQHYLFDTWTFLQNISMVLTCSSYSVQFDQFFFLCYSTKDCGIILNFFVFKQLNCLNFVEHLCRTNLKLVHAVSSLTHFLLMLFKQSLCNYLSLFLGKHDSRTCQLFMFKSQNRPGCSWGSLWTQWGTAFLSLYFKFSVQCF